MTLNQLIAAQPTKGKKSEVALHGGLPPTQVQNLARDAAATRQIAADPNPPASHGTEFQRTCKEQLKKRFLDVMFPALWKDDTGPFEELIAAMRNERRTRRCRTWEEYAAGIAKVKVASQNPRKKERGRLLRLAMLNLKPEQRTSWPVVLESLVASGLSGLDEKHVRDVAGELGADFQLLRPGDVVHFFLFSFSDNKYYWKRKIIVGRNGYYENRGMSEEKYNAFSGQKAWQIEPASKLGRKS